MRKKSLFINTTIMMNMKKLLFSFLVFLLGVGFSIEVYAQSKYGPIAGGVTSYIEDGVTLYKAKLFAKPDANGDTKIDFKYSVYSDLSEPSIAPTTPVFVTSSSDYTAIVEITGLIPNTTYYYTPRFFDGTEMKDDFQLSYPTSYPQFKTGPTPNEDTEFTFGYLTDFAIVWDKLLTNSFSSLGSENPDFVYVGGDLDHRNPYKPEAGRPGALNDYWAMHRSNINKNKDLASRDKYVADILRKAWIFHSWGDHDYCRGNEDKGCPTKANALDAFKEYYPSHTLANEKFFWQGIWRDFTYGNADFFVLDVYYKKDPNDDEDNADKSMLGDAQKEWLKTSLAASSARWKFVFTDLSWHPTAKNAESWSIFSTERTELVDFIREEKIKNVIFLSGDWHAGALDNGINTDFWTMVVTSVDNGMNIEGEGVPCDTASWTDGGFGEWSHGTFGVDGSDTDGKCAGYGLIEVKTDPHRVILSVKDQDGNSVITGTVPDEVVIDNGDGGFGVEGTWPSSTATAVFYGKDFRYHAAGTGANTATWSAELTNGAGEYEVFVWYPVCPIHLATNAPYTINHDGESHTVRVNQLGTGGRWVSLGAYKFTNEVGEGITLTDNANGTVVADAVKFVPPDGIIDNADFGFNVAGDWESYNTVYDYGKDFRYHAAGTGANTVTWSAELTDGLSSYEVFVWYPEDSDLAFVLATDAKYTIDHAGGSDTVLVDQTVNGGRWVSIGIYDFADDGTERVTLSDNADGYVAADAVKFDNVFDTFTGTVSSSNTDAIFTFDVESAGNISAILSWNTSADLDMYLYPPDEDPTDGTWVTRAYTLSNPEQISHPTTVTGTWSIRVNFYGFYGPASSFTLDVTYPVGSGS